MSNGQIKQSTAKLILNHLGFRTNTASRYRQALRDFQAGWNLGAALEIDGLCGPKTSRALMTSYSRLRSGKGTLSANFSFKEFACHCGGRFRACRRIAGEGRPGHHTHVLRQLVQDLEKYRAAYAPTGMSIVSGYRCDGYNASIGGASSSQHRWGAAADISPIVDKDTLRSRHWFAGIGFQQQTDRVRHVDRRDISGVNPTRGSRVSTTTWRYV